MLMRWKARPSALPDCKEFRDQKTPHAVTIFRAQNMFDLAMRLRLIRSILNAIKISDAHIDRITQLFGQFVEAEEDGKPVSRIFRNEDFGYTTITVERPLRDEAGQPVLGLKGKQKGKPQPDSALRDTENVPLSEDLQAYFEREVLPHAPDAWIDPDKTKVGYEIPFNRHFYVFKPPRPLAEIDADLKRSTDRILDMIRGLSA